MTCTLHSKIQQAQELLRTQPLPAVPQDVLLLKEELSKRYPNTVRVANLISLDADNLTLFLKIANACLDKEEVTIADARAAVNIIGLGDVFNFYMSSVLSRKLLDNKGEEHILSRSLRVGIVAAELSYWVYEVSRSEAFMLGLLTDIGTIFLLRKEPDYQVIMDKMVSFPFTQFEKEVLFFETDHAVMSSILSKKWGAVDETVKAILFHHDREFEQKLSRHPKAAIMTALSMVSNFVVDSDQGEFTSAELKEYGQLGQHFLDLPNEALHAARGALEKWGHSGLLASSH
jgi:HD-like signal output (HDOD) protein